MSAVFVLAQRSSAHLICDAAGYTRDGVLVSNNATKCVAVPTIEAAVACTGAIENSALFATNIARVFDSFDQLVEHGSRWLPEVFEDHSRHFRGGDATSTLYLIGWLGKEDRPAAFAINMWTDGSTHVETVLANSRNAMSAQRNTLIEQVGIAGTPLPSMSLIKAAGFRVRDCADDYDHEHDLLHLVEIARHERIEGSHWVGGCAMLTTIDRRGITQRVLHRWPEDVIGEPIRPRPIDWTAWRAEREREKEPVQLSRLQRELADRKARKASRRAER